MVRNIDLPEAVVFYGMDSILDPSGDPLPGVESILRECQDIQAASIVLVDDGADNDRSTLLLEKQYGLKRHCDSEHPPPNPRALLEAIEATTVQPKGFGGSSGFGTKLAEPERTPLAHHVVVCARTEDQCRAARFFGARVMSLEDNDIADGVLFEWSEIGVDDISTPGSYWLNPPPGGRDDEGNKVDDIYALMESFETKEPSIHSQQPSNELVDENLTEEALKAILNDLDPI